MGSLITNEQYRDIKKKNHKQLNDYILRIWQDGYNSGVMAARKGKATTVKPTDIENALGQIKGLGEMNIKVIMQQIYKLYEVDG